MPGNDQECTSCPPTKSFSRNLFRRQQLVENSYQQTLQSLIAFAHHLSKKLELKRPFFGNTTRPNRVVLFWRIPHESHYEVARRHNTAESCTGARQDIEECLPATEQRPSVVIA